MALPAGEGVSHLQSTTEDELALLGQLAGTLRTRIANERAIAAHQAQQLTQCKEDLVASSEKLSSLKTVIQSLEDTLSRQQEAFTRAVAEDKDAASAAQAEVTIANQRMVRAVEVAEALRTQVVEHRKREAILLAENADLRAQNAEFCKEKATLVAENATLYEEMSCYRDPMVEGRQAENDRA